MPDLLAWGRLFEKTETSPAPSMETKEERSFFSFIEKDSKGDPALLEKTETSPPPSEETKDERSDQSLYLSRGELLESITFLSNK